MKINLRKLIKEEIQKLNELSYDTKKDLEQTLQWYLPKEFQDLGNNRQRQKDLVSKWVSNIKPIYVKTPGTLRDDEFLITFKNGKTVKALKGGNDRGSWYFVIAGKEMLTQKDPTQKNIQKAFSDFLGV